MNKINIEIATRDDIPEILAIQKLAFYDVAKHYNNFRLGPLQTTIEELEESYDEYTYFKVVAGNIVGSAKVNIDGPVCHIRNVIVHPSYQRQGIGKMLISHIVAHQPDIKWYELFTGKDTPGNVPFYEKLGFRIIRETPATSTEPVLVIMRKESD